MKIPLTKGLFAIVDEEDYENLSRYQWYVLGHKNKEYAARYVGNNKHLRMHRILLNAPDGIEVDHINGNRLDNRKCNLRLATRAENGRNRGKFKCKTHSKYKGVTYHTRDKRWQGTIIINRRHIHLGYFDTEQEAALAYNDAALKFHGKFAKLNEV